MFIILKHGDRFFSDFYSCIKRQMVKSKYCNIELLKASTRIFTCRFSLPMYDVFMLLACHSQGKSGGSAQQTVLRSIEGPHLDWLFC